MKKQQLKKEIQELTKKRKELETQIDLVIEEQSLLLKNYVLENLNMFLENNEFMIYTQNMLEARNPHNNKIYNFIVKLECPFRFKIELSKEIELSVGLSHIGILFKDNKSIKSFIKKYNLKLMDPTNISIVKKYKQLMEQ